ncbi:MAG TPA: MFS transporter, partial [Aldersonia sp.]
LRFHPRIVTAMVMFFGTVAFVAFGTSFHHTALVMVLAVLVGVAANGGVAAYYAISPPIYPTAIRASAVGLMMGFGRIVAFLAPNIAAFMLSHGLTPAGVYLVYAGVLGVAGIAVIFLHRTYRGGNALDAMQIESRVGLDLDTAAGKTPDAAVGLALVASAIGGRVCGREPSEADLDDDEQRWYGIGQRRSHTTVCA